MKIKDKLYTFNFRIEIEKLYLVVVKLLMLKYKNAKSNAFIENQYFLLNNN